MLYTNVVILVSDNPQTYSVLYIHLYRSDNIWPIQFKGNLKETGDSDKMLIPHLGDITMSF